MDHALAFLRANAPSLPILRWLPNYKREYIVGDVVAGITVGLMVVPQGLHFV